MWSYCKGPSNALTNLKNLLNFRHLLSSWGPIKGQFAPAPPPPPLSAALINGDDDGSGRVMMIINDDVGGDDD